MAAIKKGRVGDGTPGPGRPKGVPNKMTHSIRQSFLEAFERMGGADALLKWGMENQTDFFKLASKLIPIEVSGPDGGAIKLQHTDGLKAKVLGALPKETLEEILKGLRASE